MESSANTKETKVCIEMNPLERENALRRQDSSSRIVDYTIRALQNKRIIQKLDSSEESGEAPQHAWIFQFIDIIYVGTIYNISGIITECGPSSNVFITCFAYFVIMFSSRLSFDVYNCVSGASGVPHLVAFCLYGAGVFFMTVNIRVTSEEEVASENLHSSDLGTCQYSKDYNAGFAVSFIFTRAVLVIMYVLYFYFFHESNVQGHAPDMMKNLSSADLEAAALEITRKISSGGEHSHSSSHSSHVHNPMSFRSTQQAEDLIRDLHMHNRESVVRRHFTRICLLKIGPAVVSSLVAIGLVAGASPIVILPIVAAVEFSGDFITAYFVKEASDWKDLTVRRQFAMERLGLFFMLVLGEAVLGLAVQRFTGAQDYATTYPVLVFAFFTIFSVGMQFFEQLQTYVKEAGTHPLDLRRLSPIYIWLVCLTSFFMLVASNGIVGIYEHILDIQQSEDISYNQKKVANGLGSVGILIIVLRCMDKMYFRQKVLPTTVFAWVEKFYVDDSVPQAKPRMNSTDSKKNFTESGVTTGFRRILPLCLMRIGVSFLQYFMFLFEISAVPFLGYTFVVTVTPNLAEVVVEMRNFFKHHFYHKSRQLNASSHQQEATA